MPSWARSGSVNAQWFRNIRSALQREVRNGLCEAMANSPLEQWEQTLNNPNQLDLEDLEQVRVNALERAKACAKNAMAKGRAAAKEWTAAAMSQGAKLARRRTARTGAKPQLVEEVINGTSHFFTPLDMVASRFHTWAAKWQNTHEATQYVVTAIQEVRTCAKASQALPKITLKDLDDAFATMNEATQMGADRFGPRFIKAPLETGRQKCADFLDECEEKVAWPWQIFTILVCWFAKKVK